MREACSHDYALLIFARHHMLSTNRRMFLYMQHGGLVLLSTPQGSPDAPTPWCRGSRCHGGAQGAMTLWCPRCNDALVLKVHWHRSASLCRCHGAQDAPAPWCTDAMVLRLHRQLKAQGARAPQCPGCRGCLGCPWCTSAIMLRIHALVLMVQQSHGASDAPMLWPVSS